MVGGWQGFRRRCWWPADGACRPGAGGGTPPLPDPVAPLRDGMGTLRLAVPGLRSLTVAALMWNAAVGMVRPSY